MNTQLICPNDYTIYHIHGHMPTQLPLYIVECLDNCEYSNDYKIDHIHSQMTIQLTIYIVK